jgi:hypothetical protein
MNKTKFSKRQVANVLRDAAKNIELYGWVRGKLGSFKQGFCAIGSINPQTNYGNVSKFMNDLNAVCIDTVEKRLLSGSKLYDYNDYEARDEKDVIKLFRRTAYELDHGSSL